MISKSLNPLVSIVFTSYNHAEFLNQAIDSLINQSYDNIEIIVVDDCSTDGSKEILLKYSSFEKVKLHLLEANTGSYVKASNYGAKFANGKYILFAQCDDFSDPTQVSSLVSAIEENKNVGVVWSRSSMVDKNGFVFEDDYVGRERKFRKRCSNDTLLSGAEMRRFLSYSCVLPNLSAALLTKELYNLVGGLSEKYLVASDWAFWLSLAENTDFYYLTKPLNNFRQHETTIRSKVKNEKQILEIFSIFYEHIQVYKLKGKYKFNLKAGFGFVWFSFLFMGFKAWVNSFSTVFRRTFSLESFNLVYFIIGILVYSREVFFNRFK
jgi:glycosyltransferase involved in cell wall biosynthesis